jgi:hypothetical protein
MPYPKVSRRNLAISVAGVIVAVLAARQAFVAAFAARSPQTVLAVMPSNPKAVVGIFDRELMSGGGEAGARKWAAGARDSLRATALTSGAIRILSLASASPEHQRSLMALAERVSRRDLFVQLWLIEDAVGRDDIAGAVMHYDRAMSVVPASRDRLFAILARALDEPEIRRELAAYVRQDRPWAYDFVGYAIDNAPAPDLVADLLARSGGSRKVPRHQPLETALLMKLVSHGDAVLAHRYASQMGKGRNTAIDRFELGDRTMDPVMRPFTWSISDDAQLTTRLDEQGNLTVVVPSGAQGSAANRVMVLKSGRWTITQAVDLPSLSPMAAGVWTAVCVGGKVSEPIWSQSLPLRPGRQNYRSSFDVPANCPAVRFNLSVRGDDSQVEAQMAVGSLALSPG